ncbi:MAG TPA: cysteine synthase A [Anaerolineae bacterium]|nr:cysteine synthase A [Anaerolineae bacterium]
MSVKWDANRKIASNIFETIGRTPLVRLNRVAEGLEAQILGKMEYFSPSGSVKDRIYYHMIRAAIEQEELKPGMTIIECSSGNAGISCALVGAVLGYPVIIVMPSEMSEERKKIIRAYGAQIIETPGGETDIDLCLEKAAELKAKEPGKYWEPAQFSNPYNVEAHYTTTGPEIWEQTGGEIDIFVAAPGTGGTLSGAARYLKERKPEVMVFAVEPKEAAILSRREWGVHSIEGIGNGFVPRNLDLSLLTGVVTVSSDEAFQMARRLAMEEGIFCGPSSGGNVAAALKLAERYPEARTIVTMINDTGQRYFSTPLCGEAKEIQVPEREHPMDEYTRSQLDKYQARWVIIE